MPESDDLTSLEDFSRRIDAVHAQSEHARADTEKKDQESGSLGKSLAEATRMAWSFLAGASTGCVLGYALDRWLESSPAFLLIGFFAGFAAGVFNLIRGAQSK